MKSYSEYKETGIENIGKIPTHWNVLSVRRITKEHKQGYYSSEEYSTKGYKLLRITDIDDNANVSYSDCPFVDLTI